MLPVSLNFVVRNCFSISYRVLVPTNANLVKYFRTDLEQVSTSTESHFWFESTAAKRTVTNPTFTRHDLQWYYFESGHGKGEHDGAGAVVKSALRKWQLVRDGQSLMVSAADAVKLLTERLSGAAATSYPSKAAVREGVNRRFILVGESDVDRSVPYDCKQIPGTRSFHAVRGAGGTNVTTLFHRELACFCRHCFNKEFHRCESTAYAGPWTQVELQPLQLPPRDDLEDDGDDDDADAPRFGGEDHNELPALLEPGDFFAVRAEDENEMYWLAKCTQGMHKLTAPTRDQWGGEFEAGDVVVCCKYLSHHSSVTGLRKYEFSVPNEEAIIYSHLVKAIKLRIDPEDARERKQRKRKANQPPIYNLRLEDHERIMNELDDEL